MQAILILEISGIVSIKQGIYGGLFIAEADMKRDEMCNHVKLVHVQPGAIHEPSNKVL